MTTPHAPSTISRFAFSAAAVVTLAAGMGVAPQPSGIARAWQLQVDFGPLRVWSGGGETTEGARAFFYMTYKAVNRSGKDVIFAPSFDLVDGDGRVTKSGSGVPSDVIDTLKGRVSGTLVQDQVSIIGMMSQGEENAKEGIVVWTCEDLTPGSITVYAGGFSGETAVVKLPGGGGGRDAWATLRKSASLRFSDPGDLANRRDLALDRAETAWVMR